MEILEISNLVVTDTLPEILLGETMGDVEFDITKFYDFIFECVCTNCNTTVKVLISQQLKLSWLVEPGNLIIKSICPNCTKTSMILIPQQQKTLWHNELQYRRRRTLEAVGLAANKGVE